MPCLVHTGTRLCIQEYTGVPRKAVTCPAELEGPSPLPVAPFSRQHESMAVMPEDLLPGSTELLALHIQANLPSQSASGKVNRGVKGCVSLCSFTALFGTAQHQAAGCLPEPNSTELRAGKDN